MNLLEAIENEKRTNGESDIISTLLNSYWVREGSNNSDGNSAVGKRGSRNRNAGVLPRQSRRKPSAAFRNVVENIFEVQRDVDDVFAPPRHKAKEPSKRMALLLGAEGEI